MTDEEFKELEEKYRAEVERRRSKKRLGVMMKDLEFAKEEGRSYNTVCCHLTSEEQEKLLNHERELNNRLILKTREQQRVLSIIFKKGLPLGEIAMIKQSANYNEYNIKFSWANFKDISIQKTEEEFDLLKRWLNK